MNKIDHEELFGSVKDFLKSKGIDLQDGTYTHRIRQGCGLLADSINMGHQAWTKAKTTMDEQIDKLRQTIHEQTAPKPPPVQTAPPPTQSASAESEATPKSSAKKAKVTGAKGRSPKSKR